MKPISLIFIATLAFSSTLFADSNSCLRFYGQRTKVTFFTTPIGENGIKINQQTITDAISLFQKQSDINTLDSQASGLYDKENQISRDIRKARSDRPFLKLFSSADPHNIQIDVLKKELKQVTTAIKAISIKLKDLRKAHNKELIKLEEQFIANGTKSLLENVSLAHLNRSLKDPSSMEINTRSQIYFNAATNTFNRQYYIKADIYGSPIDIPVLVKTGFRKTKSGSPEIYSFIVTNSGPPSKTDKVKHLAALEIFKRNSMLTSSIQIRNGSTIEQKFRKLGYDLKDPKVQSLIAKLKEQQFTNAKAAARAEELLEAANQRYQDGLSDSQNLYLTHYLYYSAFSQNTNAFTPPNHWILYHLQHGTPAQHVSLGESFVKASELAKDTTINLSAETFDSIVKMDASDILTVKEALDSPEYKSELVTGGIAEMLGISESRIEQMDSERIDDPAFSGGSEAETKTNDAYNNDSSGSTGGYESPTDNSPTDSGGGGGE